MADAATKTFKGTFLTPGVSLNRRLYTKEMIGSAVATMQARIADPDGLPIVMRTHHQAADNSRLIVGRVTRAIQASDGSGTYEARWYDTAPARDIAELVQPADGGPPGLRSVSIHGYFVDPRETEVDGETVITAASLEVDAIDFTATPGVVKALVKTESAYRESVESRLPRGGRIPISETWEAPVADVAEITEEVPPAPPLEGEPEVEAYTAVQKKDMLDKGQAMPNAKGDPSYMIRNKSDLRKAIKAVGRGNADHDTIRAHVIKRAAALGLSAMIPDNWNTDGSLKETATRFGEIRECYDTPGSSTGAGFAIDAYNGPMSLTMRGPNIDPGDLRVVAAAAMAAAMDALQALDPDMDADIDLPGAPDEDSDQGAAQVDAEDPDEEDPPVPDPGSGCPCGCGCAVPHPMAGGSGCPCACGCEVCGADADESAALPSAAAAEAAPPAAPVPADPVSPAAPESTATKESAVSETAPAAEAATPPTPAPVPAPAVEAAPAPVPVAAAPGAPAPQAVPATPPQLVVGFTQEQFLQLLGRIAPAVETAPAVAPQPVAPVAAPAPAVEAAPSVAEAAPAAPAALTKDDLAEALKGMLPGLRDQIVSQYGLPPRRGFRTSETDGAPDKEQTPEQLWSNRADILLGDFGKAGA